MLLAMRHTRRPAGPATGTAAGSTLHGATERATIEQALRRHVVAATSATADRPHVHVIADDDNGSSHEARADDAGHADRAGQAIAPSPTAECPHCTRASGFLIDIGGAAYRVLEDTADTELLMDLTPEDLTDIGRAECVACGKKTDATELLLPALEALRAPQQVTIGTGRTKNRLHFAGKAALRIDHDGTTAWPACPDCGATHDFVMDLDGTAYMVLEDDDDTELLRDSDASNLLCSRCSAVFDL